ncbi:signaling protein [Streptomyces sp. NPDC015130]|uniref:phage baseplate protein n=1 Tax=Streptomyces sp. NPDC015130 TaxID=3364940 RepID=UPI0036F6243E
MSLSRRSLLTAIAAAPVLASVGAAEASAAPQAAPQAAPATVPVAANPPTGGLPDAHRFDLKSAPVDLLGKEIPLNHKRVHQQVAFDPVTGLAYAVQGMPGSHLLRDETVVLSRAERDARGDLCVNQVAPDGTVLAVMHLRGFGHGAGLGVEHVDGTAWLWLETDADRAALGSNAHGKHIGRIAFQADAIVDAGSELVEVFDPVPGTSGVTPSLDLDHGRIAVRQVTSGTAEYRVYDLAAFKSRDFTPQHRFPVKHSTQSWCLYGNFVYQNAGDAYSAANPSPGNSWWTVYDVNAGVVIERIFNTTALELNHRETEAITVRRTPDGQPQLVFGFATQENRLMALYGITSTTAWIPLAFDRNVYTASDSYLPQYRQSGDRVDIHLRVSHVDTTVRWASGETILTLPAHLRPSRTQSLVGTTTGSGDITGSLTTRFEVTADGQLRIFDERAFTGWVGLDAGYFTV